jgi:hypothetical protein
MEIPEVQSFMGSLTEELLLTLCVAGDQNCPYYSVEEPTMYMYNNRPLGRINDKGHHHGMSVQLGRTLMHQLKLQLRRGDIRSRLICKTSNRSHLLAGHVSNLLGQETNGRLSGCDERTE